MIASRKQMDQMNDIQFDIFKEVISICDKLNLQYFMVHGSLLGTIRKSDFMPLDDDIDIAMPRKDYEVLISEGQKYLNKNLFIQSSKTDKEWPLSFAKVRNSNYTYIAEPVKHLNINHGVFIDIFPLDFYVIPTFSSNIIEKILSMRINRVLNVKHKNFQTRFLQFISFFLCPSFIVATKKREQLYSKYMSGEYLIMRGGKSTDKMIPYKWFSEQKFMPFRDIMVAVPIDYKSYLNRIYGDYEKTTLLEHKESNSDGVEINASILDLERPYIFYQNN